MTWLEGPPTWLATRALRWPRRAADADILYAPPPPTCGHRRAAAADFWSARRRRQFSHTKICVILTCAIESETQNARITDI